MSNTAGNRHLLAWVMLSLILAGCTGGAVVFAPTPLPPDQVRLNYQHPSGAFTLVVPGNWAVYEQPAPALAAASFAPAGSAMPWLQVAALNLGTAIELSDLPDLMNQYQTQIRADLERYTEQDRQAMGDGSWRLVGVRREAGGRSQPLNTFIQRAGSMLGVIQVALPEDAAGRALLEQIVSSVSFNAAAELPPAALTSLTSLALAPVEVVNLNEWTTPGDVFFIAGEVRNSSSQTLASIPVRVQLQLADGSAVAEAVDTTMGYGLPPGGYAPFSLRFGQGQPADVTGYTLTLGAPNWQAEEEALAPADALRWEDASQYSAEGQLFITGTATNVSDAPLRQPLAVATVLDARGRLIGAGFAPLNASAVMPGESADFVILVADPGGTPANYSVQVQALR